MLAPVLRNYGGATIYLAVIPRDAIVRGRGGRQSYLSPSRLCFAPLNGGR